jgi:dolichol kinase
MVISTSEIKRKLFHHLSLVYMILYAATPRWLSVWLLFVLLLIVSMVEFMRLRRPELNAKLLKKFGGIHRPTEIMGPSGIFWTLLGCWLTMLVFTNKRIVLPALGFLTFGDTAAAMVGQKWGRHHWKKNPTKTYEGSAGCALVSIAWALCFVRWPVAILGGLTAAWLEARPLPYNDNLWIPTISGLALSVFNLVLGKH